MAHIILENRFQQITPIGVFKASPPSVNCIERTCELLVYNKSQNPKMLHATVSILG